jgi:hypothetical protein
MTMDRRDAIRKYKERVQPMGIFCIRNRENGKALIGSSLDVPAMLNRLRFQLQLGKHSDAALQADWTRLGAEAFTLETLDLLKPSEEPDYDPKEDLQTLLEMWRETLRAKGELY